MWKPLAVGFLIFAILAVIGLIIFIDKKNQENKNASQELTAFSKNNLEVDLDRQLVFVSTQLVSVDTSGNKIIAESKLGNSIEQDFVIFDKSISPLYLITSYEKEGSFVLEEASNVLTNVKPLEGKIVQMMIKTGPTLENKDALKCNISFLNYLQGKALKLDCTPYVTQITHYE